MKFLCPPLKIRSVLLVSLFLLAKAGAQTPDTSQPAETDPSANPPQAADAPQPAYAITDLGTLGGSSSSAAGMAGQQGHNAAGMIVGSSTASDNSAHAFLYSNGQMSDLNELCDLSTSDFNVLTTASSIDDAGQIIGAGITAKGQTHAFLLKPTPVDGGQWSYSCCQWIWKQGISDSSTNNNSGGSPNSGWWWESSCHCYKWHGPPGKHPPCPPNPPHCWYWPLPCAPDTGCSPYPHSCWCCFNGGYAKGGIVAQVSEEECKKRGGQCYSSQHEAQKHCSTTPTPTATPTPTDHLCWCCTKEHGVVHETIWSCNADGGVCYPTEEEANKNCKSTPAPTPTPTPTPHKPAFCWCCVNGKVSNISDMLCRARHGQCYSTQDEAVNACSGVFCCHDGSSSLEMTDCASCVKSGGRCFATQAEALKDCAKPPVKLCWCCPNLTTGGAPVRISIDDCQKAGGTCFDTEEEAIARCSVIAYSYCCVDGQVTGPMLRSACSGQAFNTADEAQKYCSSKSTPSGEYCWCCSDTKNGGTSNYMKTALCQQIGGTPFNSQEEATARCAVIPYSYCCDVGALDQTPAGPMPRADCLALNCPTCQNHYTPFDTLEDADKFCSGQKVMDLKTTLPPNAFPPPVTPGRNPVPNGTPPILHRPRVPNTPNGQPQPPPTPEVTPFRPRRTPSTPTPRVTPSKRGTPSSPVPQVTPAPDTGSKRIPTHKPAPIFHRPRTTPTPTPRQPALHRPINKSKPTPTPPIVR